MADLGFFDTAYFEQLNVDGVFWLTSVMTRIQLKLPGQSWQELGAWLSDLDRLGLKLQDIEFGVGKGDPVKMRLKAVRCPVEESARRRQQLYERMRRKGNKPSQRQLLMCD